MTVMPFILPDPQGHARDLAANWLKLGIFALLAAGMFSLLLVMSRTPAVQEVIPWLDFFHTALVVHVVLSVLVWFLAFAGVLWTASSTIASPWWDKTILAVTALGAGLIVVSPFTGDGHPLLNNYVPILQQPVFLLGLGIFGAGFVGLIIRTLMVAGWETPPQAGIYFSVVSAAVAVLALLMTGVNLPDQYSGEAFYELLFWGGAYLAIYPYVFADGGVVVVGASDGDSDRFSGASGQVVVGGNVVAGVGGSVDLCAV